MKAQVRVVVEGVLGDRNRAKSVRAESQRSKLVAMLECSLRQTRQTPAPTQGDWPKIDFDARQASRYENNKVAPGLEAVTLIPNTFYVSVDYLLIERRSSAAQCPQQPRRRLFTPQGPPSPQRAGAFGSP